MSTDPWDDWETAADAGLNDYEPKKSTKKPVDNKEIWDKANQYAAPVIIMSDNTPAYSDYKPSVKVLKRPEKSSQSQSLVSKAPIKTLADREKEYMEARRKIFGDDDQ